jgi:RNA exonuclease NGL2
MDADSIRDGNLSQHPDRVIKNSRAGREEDGLAGLDELKALFGWGKQEEGERKGVRSAYGELYGKITDEEGKWYVDRNPEVQSGSGWKVVEDPKVVEARKQGTWEERVKRGDWEPMWTNCAFDLLVLIRARVLTDFRAVTPLWRCTLEYVPLLPA